MALDRKLLTELRDSHQPLIHFYDWQSPSATFGHFINTESVLNLENVKRHGIELARRPTGGGVIFHLGDLAFSLLIPVGHAAFSRNTLESYAFVNQLILKAIHPFVDSSLHLELLPAENAACVSACCCFCMAKPTLNDVMVGARKVSGGAQRKTRWGLLHQGTICLTLPDAIKDCVASDVFASMQKYSFPLLPSNSSHTAILEIKKELKSALLRTFVKN